jgi:hypothetical protein
VVAWWHALQTRDMAPVRPNRILPTTLALSAVAAVTAMPLVWHHLHIPGGFSYTIINGLSSASWLLVVAAVALALAIRTYLAAPSLGMKWAISVLAFATVNGMFFDYFDWSTRGVSLYVPAYYGPGFFVGLGGAALTVLTAMVAWRSPG